MLDLQFIHFFFFLCVKIYSSTKHKTFTFSYKIGLGSTIHTSLKNVKTLTVFVSMDNNKVQRVEPENDIQ